MEGVVVRMKNGLRVVLTMNLIMRSVAVEVDATELDTVNAGTPHCAKDGAIWPSLRMA
jgi:hypothetical protein